MADLHFKHGLKRAPLICTLSRSLLNSCLEETSPQGSPGRHGALGKAQGPALTNQTAQPWAWGRREKDFTQLLARPCHSPGSWQVTSALAPKPKHEWLMAAECCVAFNKNSEVGTCKVRIARMKGCIRQDLALLNQEEHTAQWNSMRLQRASAFMHH